MNRSRITSSPSQIGKESRKSVATFSQVECSQVPMNMLNMKRMATIARHYKSRFTTVVGIQPTGWTHAQCKSASLIFPHVPLLIG